MIQVKRVIQSLSHLARLSRTGRKQYWRLVTHELVNGEYETILFLPGGKDSGQRNQEAIKFWNIHITKKGKAA